VVSTLTGWSCAAGCCRPTTGGSSTS
jgi:hypothetical protein